MTLAGDNIYLEGRVMETVTDDIHVTVTDSSARNIMKFNAFVLVLSRDKSAMNEIQLHHDKQGLLTIYR